MISKNVIDKFIIKILSLSSTKRLATANLSSVRWKYSLIKNSRQWILIPRRENNFGNLSLSKWQISAQHF